MRVAVAMVVFSMGVTALAGASSRSFPPPGRIVYSHSVPVAAPRGYDWRLFTAATDGTCARQITTSTPGGADLEPRWPPDGTRVAFMRVDPDSAHTAVWVVNADGSKAHRVSGDPSHAGFPKWSPDGRLIAFQEEGPYGSYSGRPDTAYTLLVVRPDWVGPQVAWRGRGV